MLIQKTVLKAWMKIVGFILAVEVEYHSDDIMLMHQLPAAPELCHVIH